MSGETDLEKLLATISPELMAGEYVFCTFEGAQYGDYADLKPIAAMQESEGLTLVIDKNTADEREMVYKPVFMGITLRVHSSLDAVGLTAAFASKLTEHGISANVIAGFYHDHLFVPENLAEKAIEALNELGN